MEVTQKVTKCILISLTVFVALTSLLAVATPTPINSEKQQDPKQVFVAPKVISKIKDLEVINTTIKRQGEPSAAIAIEIRNNSEKPIVAVAVESGDEKDASGTSANGFRAEGETPSIILPPHGTITMEIAISNLIADKPLKIAGVLYADETEDGEGPAIKTLRGQKDKAKNLSKKERPEK